MGNFAEAWPDFELVQRTVALIPWRSNITLLDKLTEPELILWYAKKTIENGFFKDMPSVGLLLVKNKNKLVVECALSGYTNLIGVANWESDITKSLPDHVKESLPTIEEIENELKEI
jgi:hypothetical protein